MSMYYRILTRSGVSSSQVSPIVLRKAAQYTKKNGGNALTLVNGLANANNGGTITPRRLKKGLSFPLGLA